MYRYSVLSSLSSKRVMALPAVATGAVKSMLTVLSPERTALGGSSMWPFSIFEGTAVPLTVRFVAVPSRKSSKTGPEEFE